LRQQKRGLVGLGNTESRREGAIDIFVWQWIWHGEARGHDVAAQDFGSVSIEDRLGIVLAIRRVLERGLLKKNQPTRGVPLDADAQTATEGVGNFTYSRKHS
jgi:hypothetical protein